MLKYYHKTLQKGDFSMAEIRNLYDENRNLSTHTVVKGEPIPVGLRIVCVCTIIVNPATNEFLIQKRVPQKNGKFGLTSGHPKVGETSKEGMTTELIEELGLFVPSSELICFHSELHDEQSFRDLYYYKSNLDLSTLVYQTEEVEFAKWASFDDITELFSKAQFCHTHYEDLQKYIRYSS